MKKIIMNNRFIAIALLTLFTTAFSPVVNANEKKPALPAEIKFVGKVQNNPVFELSVPGAGVQEEYTVSVRDEHGNVLHVETIKAAGFTKKFMLSLEDNNDELNYSIQFVISTKNNKKSALYTVNNNTRNIEEVVVTRL
jgi:hypothetical protein